MKKSLQAKDYAALGAFRHAMRKLLRFSKELVATKAKLTTEQYDALLEIKGSSGANGVTVGEISEQLQVKHHTAVSLLDRLEARKLATRKRATADKRNVNVQLTKAGASLLARLAAIHHRELQQRTPEIIDALRRLRESSNHNTRDARLPSIEPAPSMLPSEIKDWPNWNNTTRINRPMCHVVMPLDVIEIHRLGNAIMLV